VKRDEIGLGSRSIREFFFGKIGAPDLDALAAEPGGRRRETEWLMPKVVGRDQQGALHGDT